MHFCASLETSMFVELMMNFYLIIYSSIVVIYCCRKTFNRDRIIKCIDINGPSCVSISYPVTSLYIVLILHALSTHFPFYILYAFNLQLQKYARLNIQCVLKTAPVIMVKAMNCIPFWSNGTYQRDILGNLALLNFLCGKHSYPMLFTRKIMIHYL